VVLLLLVLERPKVRNQCAVGLLLLASAIVMVVWLGVGGLVGGNGDGRR
jgi:hypothetical protein